MRYSAERVTRALTLLAWLGATLVLASGVAPGGHVPHQGETAKLASAPDLSAARPPDRPDPSFVALAGDSGRGTTQRIRLISPATGRLIKLLRRLEPGNGFALSPNSKDLYLVGLDRNAIAIRQIAVATGRVSFVADGAYPAVSPDSRYLAYAAGRGFREVAVRDLRTGRTTVVSLGRLIGKDSTLLNQGTVTWLGDGNEVLAVPQPDAIASAARTGAVKLKGTRCGLQESAKGLCVIAIKVSSHGLSARRIYVPGKWSRHAQLISGDYSAPRSFLIAWWGGRSGNPVFKLTLTSAGLSGRKVASLPGQALPGAFAPDGDRILYLLGSRPPVLWVATMRHGHLIDKHRLLADSNQFGVGSIAW